MGGTEYYLRSFVNYLDSAQTSHSFVLFCGKEAAPTFNNLSKRWRVVTCPVASSNRIARILYEQLLFPALVKRYNCKLLHSFGYFGPVRGNFKKIITVHDTNWLDHPEDSSVLERSVLDALIRLNIFVAKTVIVDSEFALARVRKHFPNTINKTSLIYPGVDDDFTKLLKKKSLSHRNGLYFLCISAFYPHKKVTYVVRLWKVLSKVLPNYELVLVGQNGKDADKISRAASKDQSIRWLKKVSFPKLVNLYKHAALCIIPSVYEGFGYPVYEALSAQKKTVVGKKHLYHPKLQRYLSELSFNLKKDLVLVLSTLVKKNQSRVTLPINYKTSVRQLIKIYDSALK